MDLSSCILRCEYVVCVFDPDTHQIEFKSDGVEYLLKIEVSRSADVVEGESDEILE